MELCLRFCESEIEYWAERYIECQKLSSRKAEHFLIERQDLYSAKRFYDFNRS